MADPNLILGIRPPPAVDYGAILDRQANLRNMAQGRQLQQQEIDIRSKDQADREAERARQEAERTQLRGDQQAVGQAMAAAPDLAAAEKALIDQGRPHLIPGLRKTWGETAELDAKAKEYKRKAEDAERDYAGALGYGILPFLDDPDGGMGAATIALQQAKAHGHDVAQIEQQLQANPANLRRAVQSAIDQSPTYSAILRQDAAQKEAARHNVAGEKTTAQNAADAAARAATTQAETARHNKAMEARPVAGGPNGQPNDVMLTVQGMSEGTLPPQLPGRASKEYIALLAEAKRQGYDLASAATDWAATQKHIATLNGAQQTRMAQAIDNTAHSLDVIEDLAKQWKGGKFPILNSAQLKAAKNGVLGPEAQQVATQLEAQIADVTSELGNVYMGGNSPTDHALQLASKNLSADWTQAQLISALDLARRNLAIRQNSMRNVGVAGASATNPYAPAAPPPAQPTAPSEGQEGVVNGTPAVWKTVDGKTGWYAK